MFILSSIKHLKRCQNTIFPTDTELTWRSSYASLEAGTPCTDLVRPTLTHGTHSELERAAGDVLAPVLDVDGVRSDFLGDEAHAVGAAASIHDVSVHCFPTGAGHLSCHGLGAGLNWVRKSGAEGEFRHNRRIFHIGLQASKALFKMRTLTLRPGGDPSKAAETLSSQEVSKHISEGAPSSPHLGALLHSYLPLGLPTAGFADLCALGAGVGVAAAGERPRQPLLSRNHLEPVSYSEERASGNTNVSGRQVHLFSRA